MTWSDKIVQARKINNKPMNKNYLTEEYREKRSKAAIVNGLGRSNKGKKLTAGHTEKIRIAHLGHSRGGWKMSNEIKQGRKERALRGHLAYAWKGGLTTENALARCTAEYREWRLKVFERDDFTCQECGIKGGFLHADHIKPFAYFKELRTSVSNGRTLCVPCHKNTPTYGGRYIKET